MKKIIFTLQTFLTIWLLWQLINLGALPLLYIGEITCLLLIILLSILLLDLKKNKKARRRGRVDYGASVLSVLISSALIFVNVYAYIGIDVLNKISGTNVQVRYYSVVVLEDSNFNELSDLNGEFLGVDRSTNSENIDALMDVVMENAEFVSFDEFKNITDSYNALFNKDVKALLIDESYRGFYEDEYENFTNDTRVIYSMDIQLEIQSTSSDINVTKDPFSIYISGIDTYGSVGTVSRSDVNMVLTINPVTNEIMITSIPRDSLVTLSSFGRKDKLTHAGLYGVEESMNTISDLLSIDIDFYAKVNFSSLTKIIDALGGLSVDVGSAGFVTSGGIVIKSGVNNFNGETALAFCRERYNLSGGDLARGQNQMLVIEAIINKLMSPTIITNYTSLLDAVSDCLETNMSTNDITKLVNMQISNGASWSFDSYQIDGKMSSYANCYSMPGQSLSVIIPDGESIYECILKIISVISGEDQTEIPPDETDE